MVVVSYKNGFDSLRGEGVVGIRLVYVFDIGHGKEWDELTEVWFVLVGFKAGSGDAFVRYLNGQVVCYLYCLLQHKKPELLRE